MAREALPPGFHVWAIRDGRSVDLGRICSTEGGRGVMCSCLLLRLEGGVIGCSVCGRVHSGREETAALVAEAERKRALQRADKARRARTEERLAREEKAMRREEKRDLARRKVEALEGMADGLQRSATIATWKWRGAR